MRRRKTEELYRGRVSSPGVFYFITLCVKQRSGADIAAGAGEALLDAMEALEGDVQNVSAVVMPDHVHWLFQLGHRLSLGRVISKWKTETRGFLTANTGGWQRDFFDRWKREDDPLEYFGLYIFLNPYRAGLVEDPLVGYPYYRAWRPEWLDFHQKLADGPAPIEKWLGLLDGWELMDRLED